MKEKNKYWTIFYCEDSSEISAGRRGTIKYLISKEFRVQELTTYNFKSLLIILIYFGETMMTILRKPNFISVLCFCMFLCFFKVQAQSHPLVIKLPTDSIPNLFVLDSIHRSLPRTHCDSVTIAGDCNNWGEWTSQSAIVSGIPNFDSCKLAVLYETRSCLDLGSNNYQINIIGYSTQWVASYDGVDYDSPCSDLKQYLDTLSGFNRAEALLGIEQRLYDILALDKFHQEDSIVINYSGGHHIHCDSSSAPNPLYEAPVYISYSRGSCESYVYVNVEDSITHQILNIYTPLTCTETWCCKHWQTYCYDDNDSLIVNTYNSSDGAEKCNETIPPEQLADKIINDFKKWYNMLKNIVIPCTPSCSDYRDEIKIGD